MHPCINNAIRDLVTIHLPKKNSETDNEKLLEKIKKFLEEDPDILQFKPPRIDYDTDKPQITISAAYNEVSYALKNVLECEILEYEINDIRYSIVNNFGSFSQKTIVDLKQDPPTITDRTSLSDTVQSVLATKEIKYLFVAESHTDKASEIFLKTYKESLLSNGFEILASEFYCTEQQPMLDVHHFNKMNDFPAPWVNPYPINRSDHPCRKRVAEEFNEIGIRIIALEDPKAVNITSKNINERISSVDASAYHAIQKEVINRGIEKKILSRNPNGKSKVIIWVGAAHANGIAKKLGRSQCAIVGTETTTHSEGPSYLINSHIYGYAVDLLIRYPGELD